VAILCLAAGAVGSVLAARSLARTDASNARKAFPQASAAIASTLKLAVQREEELTVSASTFFARNPTTSSAEFHTWVNWARTARRFPELDNLPADARTHAGTCSVSGTRGRSCAQAGDAAKLGDAKHCVVKPRDHASCRAALGRDLARKTEDRSLERTPLLLSGRRRTDARRGRGRAGGP